MIVSFFIMLIASGPQLALSTELIASVLRLCHPVEQLPGVFQVGDVEALGEPAVHRGEEVVGLRPLAPAPTTASTLPRGLGRLAGPRAA